MKQKLLLGLLICSFIESYSQERKTNFQLSFGPTLSVPKTSKLVDSDLDGAPEIESSINVGLYVLPSINYSLNKNTSLDFGLGFYLDRFAIEDKIGPLTNKGNRNIGQIQIPVNVNFHFGKNNSYQIGAGGFASFLLFAKEKGKTDIDLSKLTPEGMGDPVFAEVNGVAYKNNLKDDFNSINFGAFIQLKKNLSFSASTKGFLLLRVNQYFNSIKKIDANSALNNYAKMKNEKEPTTVNLGIGIHL